MGEWDERMAEMEAEDALQEVGMLAGDAREEVELDRMYEEGRDGMDFCREFEEGCYPEQDYFDEPYPYGGC